jgi:hypothetical protein
MNIAEHDGDFKSVFVLMPRRNFLLVKQEKTTFYSKA